MQRIGCQNSGFQPVTAVEAVGCPNSPPAWTAVAPNGVVDVAKMRLLFKLNKPRDASPFFKWTLKIYKQELHRPFSRAKHQIRFKNWNWNSLAPNSGLAAVAVLPNKPPGCAVCKFNLNQKQNLHKRKARHKTLTNTRSAKRLCSWLRLSENGLQITEMRKNHLSFHCNSNFQNIYVSTRKKNFVLICHTVAGFCPNSPVVAVVAPKGAALACGCCC